MVAQQLSLLDRAWLDAVTPKVLAIQGAFTSDDLHGTIDTPEHKNWWGILLAKLRNQGKVERIGYQQSKRKEANGRVVAVWRCKSAP